MRPKFISLIVGSALALGTLAVYAQGHGPGGCGAGMHANPLEHLTKSLNLTSDQQAKVGPIIDQAKPQIVAIHQDAMQKMKTVIQNSVAQIRPLLTSAQQQKLDAMQKAHEDMINAMKEMHDAGKE
jgi:Spy/CpxP family protein refolding chaperone